MPAGSRSPTTGWRCDAGATVWLVGTPSDAAVDRGVAWDALLAELARRPATDLDAHELDVLADAQFWTDDVMASIDTRRDAYRAHDAVGDNEAAAFACWRLFYDHFLVGESAVAGGWLERCRRHVARVESDVVDGWLCLADADVAMTAGRAGDARPHAERAVAIGSAHADADLHAMALQMLGRVEIAEGDSTRGLSRLDEAMVAVINDELQPLYTGWVYCNVVATCFGLADLRRASEWGAAAMRWCTSLRNGLMYPGLCRVYAAELSWLHGDWDEAEALARRACEDLEAFDARYSGEAHYLVGELARLRGDTAAAARSFARADELGREPFPGLARLWAAEGDQARAVRALEAQLALGPAGPIARALLARALVDVSVEAGDLEAAAQAAARVGGDGAGPAVIEAHAAAARGSVALGRGRVAEAATELRRAADVFAETGCRHDEAVARLALADALEASGDHDGADRARHRVRATLQPFRGPAPSSDRRRSPLTAREEEVLVLVADGLTNSQIADRLSLSPHTVARHVANITTKLGVNGRAAATAKAYGLGLLE